MTFYMYPYNGILHRYRSSCRDTGLVEKTLTLGMDVPMRVPRINIPNRPFLYTHGKMENLLKYDIHQWGYSATPKNWCFFFMENPSVNGWFSSFPKRPQARVAKCSSTGNWRRRWWRRRNSSKFSCLEGKFPIVDFHEFPMNITLNSMSWSYLINTNLL